MYDTGVIIKVDSNAELILTRPIIIDTYRTNANDGS